MGTGQFGTLRPVRGGTSLQTEVSHSSDNLSGHLAGETGHNDGSVMGRTSP